MLIVIELNVEEEKLCNARKVTGQRLKVVHIHRNFSGLCCVEQKKNDTKTFNEHSSDSKQSNNNS